MDGFEYKGSSRGLQRRLDELARLDVQGFPNATYDLLRTVLECAIKDYFKAKSKALPANSMLGKCIEALAQEFKGDRRMTTLINAVNRKGSMLASQYTGTAPSLNAANHEPDSFATGRDAHEGWDRIKPILIQIVGK
jgi:hypothetical protein